MNDEMEWNGQQRKDFQFFLEIPSDHSFKF